MIRCMSRNPDLVVVCAGPAPDAGIARARAATKKAVTMPTT
jgi:hypothetical protein